MARSGQKVNATKLASRLKAGPEPRRTRCRPCCRRAAAGTCGTRRCRRPGLPPSADALHRPAAARGWPGPRPYRTGPAAARSGSAGHKAGPLAAKLMEH